MGSHTSGPPGGGLGADLAIIGAGMAGISAALWADRIGLSFVWIEECESVGGQLLRVASPIPDWPGGPADDGQAFLAPIASHLREARLWPTHQARVTGLGEHVVALDGGLQVGCRAVVVCTGLERRRLGVDGEDRLAGVSYSASRDRGGAAGHQVVVVGGGDGAVENAALLREVGCHVTLVHRGSSLSARADLVDRLDGTHVLLGRQVVELRGTEQVTGVALDDGSTIEASWVFVKIGFAPRTDFLRGVVTCDQTGYVVVDTGQRTSCPWVFAAGDVCSPRDPALTVAAGQATVAVKSAAALLRQQS